MKKTLITIFTIFLIILNLCTSCFAQDSIVTPEMLQKVFEEITNLEGNEEKGTITVEDNIIKVVSKEGSYDLNYDLTEKNPTFSIEIPISQGITYKEYQEEIEKITAPMLGYIAIANIKGVDFADSMLYFMFSYLGTVDFESAMQNGYQIIDDLNADEGVTVEKDTSKQNVIYTSEFEKDVMKYVNLLHKDETITDTEDDGINSYTFTFEKKDVTETSCKLKSTLAVNLDADYSKLNGYSEKLEEDLKDSFEETFENIIENIQVDNNINNNEISLNNTNTIPNAGKVEKKMEIALNIIILTSLIAIVAVIAKRDNKKV